MITAHRDSNRLRLVSAAVSPIRNPFTLAVIDATPSLLGGLCQLSQLRVCLVTYVCLKCLFPAPRGCLPQAIQRTAKNFMQTTLFPVHITRRFLIFEPLCNTHVRVSCC